MVELLSKPLYIPPNIFCCHLEGPEWQRALLFGFLGLVGVTLTLGFLYLNRHSCCLPGLEFLEDLKLYVDTTIDNDM